MVAMEVTVTLATKRVIYISQYKVAAVPYLVIDISAISRPRKLKFAMQMHLHLNNQFSQQLLGKLW